MVVMHLKQRVRTKLEKVAAILKSEITHDALEFIQIIQADARRALSSNARCFVFRRRFHSDFHTQGIRSLSAVPPIDSIRLVTAKVLGGLDGGSWGRLQNENAFEFYKVIALTCRTGILALDGPRRHGNDNDETRDAGNGMALRHCALPMQMPACGEDVVNG
jgi:hypothetical protein